METDHERLIAAAKLQGRILLLMEMRRWLDARIEAAKRENEGLWERSATATNTEVR